MNEWFLYVVLALMIGMMFINSRKRKKQLAELKATIVVGAQVILHSGITGRIVAQDGDRLVLETTPGVKLAVLQGAVRGLDSWKPTFAASKAAPKTAAKKPAAAKTATKPAAKKPAAKKAAPKKTAK
ncbi:MAG: hypothetical protein RL670_199 [Actinomycetota bacterium]